MPETAALPDLISQAQTTEEQFLRHIFVRDQMAEWSKNPLIMARADGVYYWDIHGRHRNDRKNP
jgi:adenosylmethionine-8-amino-7-oxononanoate aminotransferase